MATKDIEGEEIILGPVKDVMGREVRFFVYDGLIGSMQIKDAGHEVVNLVLDKRALKDISDRAAVAAGSISQISIKE